MRGEPSISLAAWARLLGQRLGLGSHTIIDLPLVNVVPDYHLHTWNGSAGRAVRP